MSATLLAAALWVAAPCPTTVGAPAGETRASTEERQAFLDARIDLAARRSGAWALTWGLTYVTSAALQFGLSPLASRGTRIDLYVGGTSATIGALTRAVLIPRVIKERRRLRRRPRSEDQCARLQATELAVARSAKAEAFGRSLPLHLAIIGYNTAIGFILGVGLKRPLPGNRQAVIGMVAGEALLLTQPTVMTRTLTEYRAGAPKLTASPLVLAGGGGFSLSGRF